MSLQRVECAGSSLVDKYLWKRVPEFQLAHLVEWSPLVPICWAIRCGVGFLSSSEHIWQSGMRWLQFHRLAQKRVECAGSNFFDEIRFLSSS